MISGFCSAAALTAIATQMKGLLGLRFQGSSFLAVWKGVFENISDINYYDAGLGFLTIFMLLIMRVSQIFQLISRLATRSTSCILISLFIFIFSVVKKLTCMVNLEVFKQMACFQNRWISRALWFVSTSRNASVLIFSCLAAYLLEINGMNQLTLSGIQNAPSQTAVQSSYFPFKIG